MGDSGITIVKQHPNLGQGEMVTLDRRLWLTAGRDAVVEDGDPDAAFLYGTAGKKVPREEAERLGAVPAEKPQRKQAAKTEDKQAVKHEDKSAR